MFAFNEAKCGVVNRLNWYPAYIYIHILFRHALIDSLVIKRMRVKIFIFKLNILIGVFILILYNILPREQRIKNW